jgi:hypothetical protein
MSATYEPISTQTLGTAIADIFFNSIPQTYTDLVLVISSNASSNTQTAYRLNGDSGNNYSDTRLSGDGGTARSTRVTSDTFARLDWYGGADSSGRNVLIAHFFNYTNATTRKTVLSRGDNAGGLIAGTTAVASLWRATPAAITSINILTSSGGNFSVGSTFTLYGIKAE